MWVARVGGQSLNVGFVYTGSQLREKEFVRHVTKLHSCLDGVIATWHMLASPSNFPRWWWVATLVKNVMEECYGISLPKVGTRGTLGRLHWCHPTATELSPYLPHWVGFSLQAPAWAQNCLLSKEFTVYWKQELGWTGRETVDVHTDNIIVSDLRNAINS